MIYKKLPIIKAGSYCILCKGDLKKKNCRISVYKKELEKDIAEELLFCDHCGIPYATSEVFTNIRHKNDGFVAEGYMFSKKSNVCHLAKKQGLVFANFCLNVQICYFWTNLQTTLTPKPKQLLAKTLVSLKAQFCL